MTDFLRTRIAAALASTYGKTQSWEEMADAVIRELDMARNIPKYPESYSDRQLLESVWRRIDGLAEMLSDPSDRKSP